MYNVYIETSEIDLWFIYIYYIYGLNMNIYPDTMQVEESLYIYISHHHTLSCVGCTRMCGCKVCGRTPT